MPMLLTEGRPKLCLDSVDSALGFSSFKESDDEIKQRNHWWSPYEL